MVVASTGPIFIVGCHRSGKTLLRLMLDSHPLVAVPPESHFITQAYFRRRDLVGGAGFVSVDRFLGLLEHHRHFLDWGLPLEEVGAQLRRNQRLTLPRALATPFEVYAARHGKERWGDKTPMYVRHIPVLASLFPGAQFIHLIRDGRDVLASTGARGYVPDVWSTAYHWWSMVTSGKRGGALIPGRYLEIRYERFVEEPEKTLRQICDLVGLEFDRAMLDYTARVKVAIPERRQKRRQKMAVSMPPTPHLRDWRIEVAPRQIAVFESIAGDLLDEIGYGRSIRRLPLVLRACAWLYRRAGALRNLLGLDWTYLSLRKRLTGRRPIREAQFD